MKLSNLKISSHISTYYYTCNATYKFYVDVCIVQGDTKLLVSSAVWLALCTWRYNVRTFLLIYHYVYCIFIPRL